MLNAPSPAQLPEAQLALLTGSFSVPDGAVIGPDRTLAGRGSVPAGSGTFFLDLKGAVDPGFTGEIQPTATARIDSTAALRMADTATLAFDLAGTTPNTGHDQFTTTRAVQLDGSLVVRFDPGFTPMSGDTFTLITSGAGVSNEITGDFDTVSIQGLQGPLGATISRTANTLAVTVGCTGDTDGSGTIDTADLLRILANFNQPVAGGPAGGDVNSDGQVNTADLLVVLASFNATCP